MAKILFIGADPYPPYQFYEGCEVKGIDYEVVREIVEKMGYEGIFIIKDWKIIQELFDQKKLDMVFQVTKTPEREKKWIFSKEKLRDARECIVAYKDCRTKFTGWPDFLDHLKSNGLKLGVMKGYRYGEPVDSLSSEFKIEYASLDEMLNSINSGQAHQRFSSNTRKLQQSQYNYYYKLSFPSTSICFFI